MFKKIQYFNEESKLILKPLISVLEPSNILTSFQIRNLNFEKVQLEIEIFNLNLYNL